MNNGINAISGITGVKIPECGEGAEYPVVTSGCVISAATSLYEADRLLDEALCGILGDLDVFGSETPTNSTNITVETGKKHVNVNTRLSRGNTAGMTPSELTITDINSDEFTNTNVLRIINVESEQPNLYNGLYLSNVWDCGEFDGETQTYDYMNNVRQNDPLNGQLN